MALEWREETCEDCGAERERSWSVREIAKGLPVPKGYRVEHRGASWKRAAAPTTTTTLCLCDTAE
jgi:hypothetical protein